jgi:hypothetical protein
MTCIEVGLPEWTSQVEAAKRLGCSPRVIRKLGRAGHLSVRRLPLADPLYLVTDLDRLAQRCTHYATPEPDPMA